MAKIFVSSTFNDLKDCRAQVGLAINRLRHLGHEDIMMEHFVAEDQRPLDLCLARVREAELYVGIFAWRYGFVPKKDNPKKLSITELEYREAVRLGIPRLLFLLDETAPWPPVFVDENRKRILKLRQVLEEDRVAGKFRSADDVGAVVSPAISKWSAERAGQAGAGSSPTLDCTEYFEALRRRYRRLDLDALTPPQREEFLQIELRSVFVEPSVRRQLPIIDVPKEVLAKLAAEGEIPQDVLNQLAPEELQQARDAFQKCPVEPLLSSITVDGSSRAVILGDPGSGKSTLSRYLLLSLVDGAPEPSLAPLAGSVPVLIELKHFAALRREGKCENFLQYLRVLDNAENLGLNVEAFEAHLRTSRETLFIFDGLDEIFDPEAREDVARRIAGFAAKYRSARVLVTSRIVGYNPKILIDAGFVHFTLQDLDDNQIKQFVGQWYALALHDRPADEISQRASRILRSFAEASSIRQLAGNPMLLTIMAIIGKHQELPRERWKLYDHAALVLIEHWDVRRHLKEAIPDAPYIDEEDKKELLRRLAFQMQGAEGGLAGNYVHREALLGMFAGYLEERYRIDPGPAKHIAQLMVQQFQQRNFILSRYGAGVYGFVHRAFLEYFCAAAFVYKYERAKTFTLEDLYAQTFDAHYRDRSWNEVLRLLCGMLEERTTGQLLERLIANEPKADEQEEAHTVNALPSQWQNFSARNPFSTRTLLALQCFNEIRNLNSVPELSEQLMDSALQEMRQPFILSSFLVLSSALQIGPRWPRRERLAEIVKHPDFVPRWVPYKATSLGRFVGTIGAGHESIRAALDELARSESPMERTCALTAISVGWPSETALLGEAASSDPDGSVRKHATTLLKDLQSTP